MHIEAVDSTSVAAIAVGSSLAVHSLLVGAFHVAFRRRRRREERRADVGLVSILKPLAGHDDDLEANLASFAGLRHHPYEIVFGVASMADDAVRAALDFMKRHPEVAARLVVTDPDAALNPKVAQLVGLAKAARGDVLVTSDSNVRVGSDYLRDVTGPLADPDVGLVTSLFAGTGERTLGAALENLQLTAIVAPSVVLSTFARVPITVGKSMAMRRRDLDALGGFEAFGGVLAEDAVMGQRVVDAGFRVATSFHPVENRNVGGSVPKSYDRHARWAKMRRAIVPRFFTLEPLLTPMIVATAAALFAPCRLTALLFVASVVVQTATSVAAVWTVRGRPLPWRYLPLEALRVLVMLACWASAWASRTVVWRGNVLAIGKDTVLTPVLRREGRVRRRWA